MIPVITLTSPIPTQSSTTTDANMVIGDNAFAYVGRGILVGSAASQAIRAGHNTTIAVEGELVGQFGISIQADSDISIGTAGSVWGAEVGIFEDTAANGVVDNDGSIFGRLAGVEFLDSANVELHNSGTIVAGRATNGASNAGVLLLTQNSEAALIDNSGQIETQLAGSFGIRSVGNGIETVLNTGTIKGNISLDLGNDFLDTSRGTLSGRIDMGGGNDTVKGSAAGDIIIGGDGNDSLVGNAGNDSIAGGNGADRVYGNSGADVLTGGANGDTFYFTSKADTGVTGLTQDRITDFTHLQADRIDLAAIDAVSGTTANNAFHWIGTQAFGGVKGELHYTVSGGNAFVSGDMDGNGTADFTIRLDHVSSLVAGDFVL